LIFGLLEYWRITGIGKEIKNLSVSSDCYDTDAISNLAVSSGIDAVIPTKANRKEQRPFDYYLYRYRHLEPFFGFQTLSGHGHALCKKLVSFAAAIEIRIIAMWLKIL